MGTKVTAGTERLPSAVVAGDFVPVVNADGTKRKLDLSKLVPSGITFAQGAAGAVYDARVITLTKDNTDISAEGGPSTNLADWRITTGTTDFSAGSGTQVFQDPVMHIGYNVSNNAGRASSSEHSVGYVIEADYQTGVYQTSELYLQHINRTGVTTVRPLFYTFNNDQATIGTTGPVMGAQYAVGGLDGAGGATFVSMRTGNQSVAEIAKIARNALYLNTLSGTPGAMTSAQSLVINPQGGSSHFLLASDGLAFVSMLSNRFAGAMQLGGYDLNGNGVPLGTDQLLGVALQYASTGTVGLRVKGKGSGTGNPVEIQNSAAAVKFSVRPGGATNDSYNVVVGSGALSATNVADGFLYIPTCAGTPNGTPTAITGLSPLVIDSTNNLLYFYSGGAWRAS